MSPCKIIYWLNFLNAKIVFADFRVIYGRALVIFTLVLTTLLIHTLHVMKTSKRPTILCTDLYVQHTRSCGLRMCSFILFCTFFSFLFLHLGYEIVIIYILFYWNLDTRTDTLPFVFFLKSFNIILPCVQAQLCCFVDDGLICSFLRSRFPVWDRSVVWCTGSV